MINRVRGTEDILDLTLHNFVVNAAKKWFEQHNFGEIRTPILEHTKLFMHSLGEQTDVVSKQMFVFNAERGEDSICLRPEATAGVIRACFQNQVNRFPWKVFLYGPMFRYERPQKGRLRQFHQFNLEVIGSEAITQDAQFISMLDTFFNTICKLEQYALKINYLGCKNDRAAYKEKLLSYLSQYEAELCETCLIRKDTNTLRIFDCKNEVCQKFYQQAPKLLDALCTGCSGEWAQLQQLLALLSVTFTVDTHLVRGLDYYNRTVFEFSSTLLGAQSAFCGGGRYSLGSDVGAKEDYQSIGAGIGMERVLLLLEPLTSQLPLPEQKPLHVILPLTIEQDPMALLLAQECQHHGLSMDIIFEKASVTNMMKKANRLGARTVIIIGQDEQQNGTVSLKDMRAGQNVIIKQNEVATYLKKHSI